MTAYLRPTAAIAPELLLPADPALALALAQRLLDKPLMSNHSHGLWGYSGRTAEGRELTIQSTGIGGPSAAAVLLALAEHGARRAVRVGRCRALASGLAPAATVVVATAAGGDGISRALSAEAPLPDRPLTVLLARKAAPAALVAAASLDLLCGDDTPASPCLEAEVVDLETAALLALGARLGLRVACGLVVAEPADERDEPAIDEALLRLGAAAASALGELVQAPGSATSSLL